MTGSLNTQTGVFSQTTTGSGTDTNFESGTNAGTPYTSGPTEGTTSFTSTETGDTRDGTVTLTNTGASRYDLLEQFDNTADGANGGNGMADFSPVGDPIYVGRASVPSGLFSGVGDDQYQYCFAAGTLVLLADGNSKAIEKIEPGEMVLAAPENDPEAKPEPCEVLEVYHNAPAKLMAVTIASSLDPLHGETIYTTEEHPFFVRGKGWIKAREISVSEQLQNSDGTSAKVVRVLRTARTEPVYNLQVAESHTYFVSTSGGVTSVLVHNASGFGGGPKTVSHGHAAPSTSAGLDDYWQAFTDWLNSNSCNPDPNVTDAQVEAALTSDSNYQTDVGAWGGSEESGCRDGRAGQDGF